MSIEKDIPNPLDQVGIEPTIKGVRLMSPGGGTVRSGEEKGASAGAETESSVLSEHHDYFSRNPIVVDSETADENQRAVTERFKEEGEKLAEKIERASSADRKIK